MLKWLQELTHDLSKLDLSDETESFFYDFSQVTVSCINGEQVESKPSEHIPVEYHIRRLLFGQQQEHIEDLEDDQEDINDDPEQVEDVEDVEDDVEQLEDVQEHVPAQYLPISRYTPDKHDKYFPKRNYEYIRRFIDKYWNQQNQEETHTQVTQSQVLEKFENAFGSGRLSDPKNLANVCDTYMSRLSQPYEYPYSMKFLSQLFHDMLSFNDKVFAWNREMTKIFCNQDWEIHDHYYDFLKSVENQEDQQLADFTEDCMKNNKFDELLDCIVFEGRLVMLNTCGRNSDYRSFSNRDHIADESTDELILDYSGQLDTNYRGAYYKEGVITLRDIVVGHLWTIYSKFDRWYEMTSGVRTSVKNGTLYIKLSPDHGS